MIITSSVKKEEPYISKTMKGECKNIGCTNSRRHGSAYCQECFDKFKK